MLVTARVFSLGMTEGKVYEFNGKKEGELRLEANEGNRTTISARVDLSNGVLSKAQASHRKDCIASLEYDRLEKSGYVIWRLVDIQPVAATK